MSPTLSPTLWMITRTVPEFHANSVYRPAFIQEVKEGFKKATEAKAYKDELKEEGLKILPYYE